jgi:hypothetical protein
MGFLTGYLIVGTVFAISGYFGMRKAKHNQAKSLFAFFGLLVGWPIVVVAGVLMVTLFSGGLF